MPFTYEIDEERDYLAVSASGKRAALVESGTVRYGMARMASILAEPTQIVLRVFRDIDEARRWLEGH